MRTLLRNASIFAGSLEQTDSSSASCLLINNDLIEHVGQESDLEIQQAVKQEIRVIDVQSKIITPSFIDGHMHLLLYGQSLEKISLEQCQSLDDVRSTIKSAARSSTSPRILCRGWSHAMTGGRAFATDLDDLDDLKRPIFVDARDLHSTWCSTSALLELGVQDMPDPAGGVIHRDDQGNPSGLLEEAAAVCITWPHIARVASMDEKLAAIEKAVEKYSAAGYTGMVEMAMDENAWEALLKLRSSRELPMRIIAHWLIAPSDDNKASLTQVDRAIELFKLYNKATSPNLCITGIKVIGDGVIDACTAALLEPYSSNGHSCEPLWRADALKEVVQKADAAGLQCAIHAIGDATVRMAIDALATLKTTGRRHRIEHLELTAPSDAARLGELGITASVQAVHADPELLRDWVKLLGPARADRAFAYKDFLDKRAVLALGSDAPTAPNFPLSNIYTATTRRSARNPSSVDVFNPHWAISLSDAFFAATAGAAYSCFLDDTTGKLQPGMKADFVVLEMDWVAERVLDGKVVETWFEGRKCFDAAADATETV